MKKINKTASKRLNLSSEKIRSLNDSKQLTNVVGGLKGTLGCDLSDPCACDCSSHMCVY